MLKRKFLTISLAAAFALSSVAFAACSANDSQNSGDGPTDLPPKQAIGEAGEAVLPSVVYTKEEEFSSSDEKTDYESENAVSVLLNGDSASCDSSYVSFSSGSVTIAKAGTYVLSGSFDGCIVVDAAGDKVWLVLNGVTVTNENYACLYIKNADKVFLFLEGENFFSSSGAFVQRDANTVDGTIFSKDDLTVNGGGSLTVTATNGHGIVCKDSFKATNGALTIAASSHAIQAKSNVSISGGNISLTAGKDGVHAENTDDAALGYVYVSGGTFSVSASGDGFSASGNMQIDDGSFSVLSGAGATSSSDSMKGFKSENIVLINGGDFIVSSADDCICSGGAMYVNGGKMSLKTGEKKGCQGVSAETYLYITDGVIDIQQSYEGIEAQHIAVSGGSVFVSSYDDGFNASESSVNSATGGALGNRGGSENVFADCSISFSGGYIYVNVSSGDGVDSNGTFEMSGGKLVVDGASSGDNAAIDYDTSGTITGGTVFAVGSSDMAVNFSSASQGSVLYALSGSAGSKIVVADSDKNAIAEHEAVRSFSCILVSSPLLEKGKTYTIDVDGVSSSITLTQLIYSVGGNPFLHRNGQDAPRR